MRLDVMELCTPELQEKLAPMRDKMKEMEDKKAVSLKVSKTNATLHYGLN